MDQVEIVLEALGGWDNITALETYITRIRVEVKDDEAVSEESLHDAGVFGVVTVDKSIQAVMGPEIEAIINAIEVLR